MKLIEHIAVKPVHNTRNIERVICQRCFTGEARYRAYSDIINMRVCVSCAEMAIKVGIGLEVLGFDKTETPVFQENQRTLHSTIHQQQ